MADAPTEARKSRHLDICLNDDVASALDAGFDGVRLRHEALPEIALADVVLETTFLGHRLQAPLIVSSMTGGTQRAREINRNLATAAQCCGIALGLGSQRVPARERCAGRHLRRSRARAGYSALRQLGCGPTQLRDHPRGREARGGRDWGRRPLPSFKSAARGAPAARRHELSRPAAQDRTVDARARRAGDRQERRLRDRAGDGAPLARRRRYGDRCSRRRRHLVGARRG